MRALPRSRSAGVWLVLALTTTLLPATWAAASLDLGASAPPGGRAIDSLGNVLEGVEVLVVDPASAARPVARAVTDAAGRFRIPGLAPDVYRIAALKDGYLTAVATFDTTTRSWIDLMLRPRPEPGTEAAAGLPDDASWVLRAPRRSLLRDVEARHDDGQASVAETAHVADDSWRLRVDQMFALAADAGDTDGRMSAGTDTLVRFDSSVGERGAVQVDGRRRSLDALVADRDRPVMQDAGALALAMTYDVSLDSKLFVSAFYDQAAISTQAVEPGGAGIERQSRSWGYDAQWQAQLDARSSLQVSMDYRGSARDVPAGLLPAVPAGFDSAFHAIAAGGRYESLPSVDHQLRVDFRAQVGAVGNAMPGYASSAGAFGAPVYDLDGIRLGLDARDTWYVGGPLSILYGLGYRHAISSADSSLITPSLGAVLSTRAAVLRVSVAYHDATVWSDDPYSVAYDPESPVGWEGELEVPLGAGVSVRAAASYDPIQVDPVDPVSLMSGDRPSIPLFVSDGNAAVDRHRVALVKETGETRTFMELESGEARGTLAAFVPFDVVPREIADRSLRYRTGRLGVRVVSSGTDLLLEYREVDEGAAIDAALTSVEQRALELRLVQDLLSRPTIGHWRLLVALRAASLESRATEIAEVQAPPAIDPAGHRVSAGLSVLF